MNSPVTHPIAGDKPLVSVAIPIFNEVNILPELTRRLGELIAGHSQWDWEVIYINDGSSDGSGELMTEQAQTNFWLKVLHLARNSGHQIAITAGVDIAKGDAVIVMDGDLQDPPELLPEMIAKWEEGYDVVYATRKKRDGESWFKLATASAFYRLLDKLTHIKIPLDTGDFRLMSRPVVNALNSMRETNRFIRGLVSWIGYRQTALYYERDSRVHGETKYTLLKMFKFALDGILSFSTVPLQIITTLGFIISITSFLAIFGVIALKLFWQAPIPAGWASLMSAILMLGGIQLICIGMIGEYVGRIFDEVRKRPLYLIDRIDEASPSCFDHSRQPITKEMSLHEYSTHGSGTRTVTK